MGQCISVIDNLILCYACNSEIFLLVNSSPGIEISKIVIINGTAKMQRSRYEVIVIIN